MKTSEQIERDAPTPFIWQVIGYIFLAALAYSFFVPIGQAVVSIFTHM